MSFLKKLKEKFVEKKKAEPKRAPAEANKEIRQDIKNVKRYEIIRPFDLEKDPVELAGIAAKIGLMHGKFGVDIVRDFNETRMYFITDNVNNVRVLEQGMQGYIFKEVDWFEILPYTFWRDKQDAFKELNELKEAGKGKELCDKVYQLLADRGTFLGYYYLTSLLPNMSQRVSESEHNMKIKPPSDYEPGLFSKKIEEINTTATSGQYNTEWGYDEAFLEGLLVKLNNHNGYAILALTGLKNAEIQRDAGYMEQGMRNIENELEKENNAPVGPFADKYWGTLKAHKTTERGQEKESLAPNYDERASLINVNLMLGHNIDSVDQQAEIKVGDKVSCEELIEILQNIDYIEVEKDLSMRQQLKKIDKNQLEILDCYGLKYKVIFDEKEIKKIEILSNTGSSFTDSEYFDSLKREEKVIESTLHEIEGMNELRWIEDLRWGVDGILYHTLINRVCRAEKEEDWQYHIYFMPETLASFLYLPPRDITGVAKQKYPMLPLPDGLKAKNMGNSYWYNVGINDSAGEKEYAVINCDNNIHKFIIGGTGTGKSYLLLNNMVEETMLGKNVALLDPHGSLMKKYLEVVDNKLGGEVKGDKLKNIEKQDVLVIDPVIELDKNNKIDLKRYPDLGSYQDRILPCKINLLNPPGLAMYEKERIETGKSMQGQKVQRAPEDYKNVKRKDVTGHMEVEQVTDGVASVLRKVFGIDFASMPRALPLMVGGIRCLIYANKYGIFTQADWLDKGEKKQIATIDTDKNASMYSKKYLDAVKQNKTCNLIDLITFLGESGLGESLRNKLYNEAKKYEDLSKSSINSQEAKVIADWIRENKDRLKRVYKEQGTALEPILDRLARIRYNTRLRRIFEVDETEFNLNEILEKKNPYTLLVNLDRSESKGLGELGSDLFGTTLVMLISQALLRRGMGEGDREINVYIDEVQNFATEELGKLYTEARKAGGRFSVALQSLSQLETEEDKTLFRKLIGNSSTIWAFRVGAEDASKISQEFGNIGEEIGSGLPVLPNRMADMKALDKDGNVCVTSMETIDISGWLPSIKNRVDKQETIDLINKTRAENGLGILSENEKLNLGCKLHNEDMFRQNYFDHINPQGKKHGDFAEEAGYRWDHVGEVMAKNYFDAKTLVDGWMNSPSHKPIILDGQYKDIGFSIDEGEMGGKDATLITVMLARVEENYNRKDVAEKPEEKVELENPAENVDVSEAQKHIDEIRSQLGGK